MNTDIDLELEEIRQANNGLLLPMDVVERAKSPNSALHHCFTWDDNEAAHQHRLWQARQVIRARVRIIPRPEGDAVKVRAYVSLTTNRSNGGGYVATSEVLDDDVLAARAMIDLRDDLLHLRVKYGAWKQLIPHIDAALEGVA